MSCGLFFNYNCIRRFNVQLDKESLKTSYRNKRNSYIRNLVNTTVNIPIDIFKGFE